ncbi:rCG43585 [Rattus norvegicus]|uniref:RCG43585 n=1 Tax=Rattus norvegicus TaxID=10116 RepID=A6JJ14_RAT|nr:rCG43585 [Rattus norvegicus]
MSNPDSKFGLVHWKEEPWGILCCPKGKILVPTGSQSQRKGGNSEKKKKRVSRG